MRSLVFIAAGALIGSLLFGTVEKQFMQTFLEYGATAETADFYYNIFLGVCIFAMFSALVLSYDKKS